MEEGIVKDWEGITKIWNYGFNKVNFKLVRR